LRPFSAEDFAFIARLLRRRSGLVLTPEKIGLFHRRLKPVLYRFGLKDLTQMVSELRLGNESLAAALAEAVTVHDTWFWRSPEQLDALRDMMPALLARRAREKRLRIWSAACATGQEAYSIAMMLDELNLVTLGWTIDLIATDLSSEALTKAERGEYGVEEAHRGLVKDQMARHFTETDHGFAISERLRRMVYFRRFNLLDSFGWLDELDLVLCRNVLIYFDRATKADILERMAETMAEHGMLVLGDGDSPQGLTRAFREYPRHSNIYIKSRQALRAAS
jgi:chemotaxis protein methyltransferase CheR